MTTNKLHSKIETKITTKLNTKSKFSVVITAAGNSTRMQSTKKKEYLALRNGKDNQTILSECIFKFLKPKLFNQVIVTVPQKDLDSIQDVIFQDERIPQELEQGSSELIFTAGGKSRQLSVFNALLKLEERQARQDEQAELDFVLIHDGARPFLSTELIKAICVMTEEKGSAIAAVPAVDTQKVVDGNGKITGHLKRSSIVAVQTPQGFNFDKLLKAHKFALTTEKEYTDDSEIYALLGEELFICPGEVANKKITYKEDL